ncbi:Phospholipid N-methyltransferase [Fontibacillus panacisegetis]|uniref:Phospholipid N-methyltransferase n=1 Tax=Fontibacillus panacisegetis TaxID=670482 RepID=A0A1G7NJ16_9BACL|nr:Phospholipid N-methyltransferase [Fontibacillus panacisegetis]
MIMNVKTWVKERSVFLYKFLRSPKQIGSITPSSRELAMAMLEPIQWQSTYAIAELGAGTGAVTKYIPNAARSGTRVILFEKDSYLRGKLTIRYPDYSCYADCLLLENALEQEGLERLDCIISGLPFFNFHQEVRDRLIQQIVASLKDDGLFIAFQYSQQMKRQLTEHFEIEVIRFVPLNIPPAFVYICRKKRVT